MKYIPMILNFFSGFLAFVLVFRVIFKLIGANSYASFVGWIYTVSGTFVSPFAGIVPSLPLGKTAVIDFSAIIALAVYLVALHIIADIIQKHAK